MVSSRRRRPTSPPPPTALRRLDECGADGLVVTHPPPAYTHTRTPSRGTHFLRVEATLRKKGGWGRDD